MPIPNFPRPGMGTIVTAVTGGAGSGAYGLAIPGAYIDPYRNFVKGCFIYADRIDRLGMNIKSFKEPLKTSLNEVMVPAIQHNFESQGRPPWKALSKKTIYNRLLEGYPRGPILQKSGRLKREATRKNIWTIQDNMLKIMLNYFDQKVPYAKYHQLGAKFRESGVTIGHLRSSIETAFGEHIATSITGSSATHMNHPKAAILPARPFFTITNDEEVEIYNIFVAWLTMKVNYYWGNGSAGLEGDVIVP